MCNPFTASPKAAQPLGFTLPHSRFHIRFNIRFNIRLSALEGDHLTLVGSCYPRKSIGNFGAFALKNFLRS